MYFHWRVTAAWMDTEMANMLNFMTRHMSDAFILASTALAFALAGTCITRLARFWYAVSTASQDKLAETVHNSLLGLAAFLLALSVSSAFSNLARVEDAIRQEALDIYRLDREFSAQGVRAGDAGALLRGYVAHVTQDEWRGLSGRAPVLSTVAQADLDGIWSRIRVMQSDPAVPGSAREAFNVLLGRIEQARAARLGAATAMIPDVFWALIVGLIATSAFMSGRYSPRKFGALVTCVHTALFGLIVALAIIFDNPFRGETSVHADLLSSALQGV